MQITNERVVQCFSDYVVVAIVTANSSCHSCGRDQRLHSATLRDDAFMTAAAAATVAIGNHADNGFCLSSSPAIQASRPPVHWAQMRPE